MQNQTLELESNKKKDLLYPLLGLFIIVVIYFYLGMCQHIYPKNIPIRNDKITFDEIERMDDIRSFITFVENIEKMDTSRLLVNIDSINNINSLSKDMRNNLKLGFLWLEVNSMKKTEFKSDVEIIKSFYNFPLRFLMLGSFLLSLFIGLFWYCLNKSYSWTLFLPYLMAWSGGLFLLLATIFIWVTAPFLTPFTTDFALQGAALSIGVPMFMELIPHTYQKMKENQANNQNPSKENAKETTSEG